MSRKTIGMAAAIVVLGGGAAVGGVLWHRSNQAHAAWAAAQPAHPDVAGWPAEFRQRIDALNTAVKQWPPNPAALGELTRLYLANGFQAEAERGLRGLLVYDPANAHWPHYLASLVAGYGRLDEAISLWRKVAALDPKYAAARLKLGEALLKTNQLDEAQAVYSDALAIAPQDPYALLGLAQVALRTGRWGAARDNLETAVAANSSFAAGYSLLATVWERLGDTESAERARSKAKLLGRFKDLSDPWQDELTRDCYDVYRLQVLAATLSATGDAPAAITLLERAIVVSPDDPRTHRQLGKIYLGLHEHAKAQAELERAIALQPTEQAAYLDLINVFRATNDRAAAIEWIKKGLKEMPHSAGIHFEMALALLAEGKPEEALPFLMKARDLDPDNVSADQQLAQAYFRMGREAEAVETMRAALARTPDNAPIVALMVRYQIRSGNAADAEKYLMEAHQAGADERTLGELVAEFQRRFGRLPRG
ncbi:MAG TPA: tetratricopeptide repeat protein [Opitutaceae bacterium]|nr:tetratricopeptide repeat protein [Opitutaceae bacterium]